MKRVAMSSCNPYGLRKLPGLKHGLAAQGICRRLFQTVYSCNQRSGMALQRPAPRELGVRGRCCALLAQENVMHEMGP